MARWPARSNTSVTCSSSDLGARNGLHGRDEMGATVTRPRLLDQAELPADTAELARFLIGKNSCERWPKARRAAVLSRPRRIVSETRRVMPGAA